MRFNFYLQFHELVLQVDNKECYHIGVVLGLFCMIPKIQNSVEVVIKHFLNSACVCQPILHSHNLGEQVISQTIQIYRIYFHLKKKLMHESSMLFTENTYLGNKLVLNYEIMEKKNHILRRCLLSKRST